MNRDMRLYMLVSDFGDSFLPVRTTVYKTLKGAEKGRKEYLKDGSKIPVIIAQVSAWERAEGADNA